MFPAVHITWVDAMVVNEWKTMADLKKDEEEDSKPCVTLGFLVKKTRQFYYVANTVTSGESEEEILSNGIIMIPRKWVKTYRELNLE